MYKTVKPFIKWAGGKSQLLDIIREKYPKKIEKYCEPFVGGGAVLLDVLSNFQPTEVLINDINPELINTYIHVKNNTDAVIALLSDMQTAFWSMDNDERKDYFYFKRNRFNELILQSADTVEKAALFIFLNKTCFNGLYRVNGKGFYNVPMGSYKKPPICDADNICLISSLLQNVEIKCGDYSECADFIDNNTFVYIDPPYRPLSETSSFNSYAKADFGDEQQIQLGHFVELISQNGAKVVASNSDPKNINENDNFFDDIYKKFIINRVSASRMINSNSKRRGSINELLIYNYLGGNLMICKKKHRYLEEFDSLPFAQDNVNGGRHICAGCAYEEGLNDGLSGNPPKKDLSHLPFSQAGSVRHKSAIEAYNEGYEHGKKSST